MLYLIQARVLRARVTVRAGVMCVRVAPWTAALFRCFRLAFQGERARWLALCRPWRGSPRHVVYELAFTCFFIASMACGNTAQEVSLIVLGQKLGQVHVCLGHRGLRMVCGGSRQTPPRTYTSMATRDHTADGHEITPAPRTLTSAKSMGRSRRLRGLEKPTSCPFAGRTLTSARKTAARKS